MVRQRTMWTLTLAFGLVLSTLTACGRDADPPRPVTVGESRPPDAQRAVTVTAKLDGGLQTVTATTAHGTPLGEQRSVPIPRVFEVYGVWSGTADGSSDVSSGLRHVGVLEPARSATAGTAMTFASSTASPFLYFYRAPRYRPEDRSAFAFQLTLEG